MKQTPEKIWLKEDSEDPDSIVWGNDQPANDCDGIEYIRADLAQRHLTSAIHSDSEGCAVLENVEYDLEYVDSETIRLTRRR